MMSNLKVSIIKKIFSVNDDAVSLWDEFEENEYIEIVGGALSVADTSDNISSATDIDKDHTVTVWSKSL